MANQPKYYFLIPGFDFPVGSVKLGSIITNLNEPHNVHFTAEEGDIDTTTIMPSDKYNVKEIVMDKSAQKAGLFARFFSAAQIGAEANMQFNKATCTMYDLSHMHTEWFNPTEDLLDKAVNSERVAKYLRLTAFKNPVYMVTGVKTVLGASVSTFNTKGRGVKILLGIDASPAGLPLSIGPQFQGNFMHQHAAGFGDSSAIVFAYRLKEIRCEGGRVKAEDKQGGDLYDAGKGKGISINEKRDEYSENAIERMEKVKYEVFDEEDGNDCVALVPKHPHSPTS